MNPQFAEVAQGFIGHYYQTFDADRSQLLSMYNESSVFTFEGQQIMGRDAIMQHLTQVRARAPRTPPTTRTLASVPQHTRQGI